MRNSYHELYVHVVWCTKGRTPQISGLVEETIYTVIGEKLPRHKASMLAMGNTADHVHMLLSISPQTNIADMMKEIKGSTAYFVNHNTEGTLYWQDGYGVLSLSRSGLTKVKEYVENQKKHHEENISIIKVLEKSSVAE